MRLKSVIINIFQIIWRLKALYLFYLYFNLYLLLNFPLFNINNLYSQDIQYKYTKDIQLDEIKKSPVVRVALKAKSKIYHAITNEEYIVPSNIITQAHTKQDSENFFYVFGPKQENFYRVYVTDITVLDQKDSIIDLNQRPNSYTPIIKELNYEKNLQFVSFINNLNFHFAKTYIDTPAELSDSQLDGYNFKLEDDLLISSILPFNLGLSLGVEKGYFQNDQGNKYNVFGILFGPILESQPIQFKNADITLAIQFAKSINYSINNKNNTEREDLATDYYAFKGKYIFKKDINSESILKNKLLGITIFNQYFNSKEENRSTINYKNMQSIGITFFIGLIF
ncbi:MAG: hypothetical protein HQK51_08790 [Oligoflexia bacterium]|nr:hypothetical protein [Oligoflexia bacterium]